MDYREKYRLERDRLRAEIERNRTPEQKAAAEEMRAKRLAYERLPGRVKTEMNELEVFRAFSIVAGLSVDAGSERNAKPPEPDIFCRIAGVPYYFELGEVADTSVAYSLAKALENDEPTGGAFSQTEPFRDILTSKARKKYESNGSPIDLLLHYQKQTPPWKEYFDDMVAKYADEINAVLRGNGGPFQRLWIFNSWESELLPERGSHCRIDPGSVRQAQRKAHPPKVPSTQPI